MNTTHIESSFVTEVDKLPSVDTLRAQWQELQTRSRCSFFLSWHWIGAWVEHLCDHDAALLVRVLHGGRLIALGILSRRRTLGIGPVQYRLHETGDRLIDGITIEYNGLLCEKGFEAEALRSVVWHFATARTDWSTLYLPATVIPASEVNGWLPNMFAARSCTRPSPFVDLASLRAAERSYWDSLSANCRSMVWRTERRLLEGFGPLTLQVTDSAAHAGEFFVELVELHQRHWSTVEGGGGGAFADARIVDFHRNLLSKTAGSGNARLVRLLAGERCVGIAYIFVWRDTAYFYQSGLDYGSLRSFGSPGLSLLTRVVQHFEREGLSRFDFLAGDSRYKLSLSNSSEPQHWIAIDRKGWLANTRRWWRAAATRSG